MIEKHQSKDKRSYLNYNAQSATIFFLWRQNLNIGGNSVELNQLLCNNTKKVRSKLVQDVHTISFNGLD